MGVPVAPTPRAYVVGVGHDTKTIGIAVDLLELMGYTGL